MFFATSQPAVRRSAYAPAMRSLDRFLDQALAAPAASVGRAAIQADDQSWTLSLDVPGVTREQLTIGIEGAVVRIETLADAPRAYKQAYELPQDIDTTASTAKLENGVLTLTLAKKQPASNVTNITIN
ncbi:MAG: Hsp20 family protein [Burkholderiaceae bacterium]|jgi:HSP20 family protein|nr:Hsp20 family protein [Burkholderiaceae bacterium]